MAFMLKHGQPLSNFDFRSHSIHISPKYARTGESLRDAPSVS